MNSSMLIIRILWSIIVLSCMTGDALDNGLLINCGLPKSTRSESTLDGRVWQSDNSPAFAPPNLNAVSSAVSADGVDLPYKVGRVFWSNITYTLSITPGPVFIRLYFFPNVTSNNTLPTQFSTSLIANNFTLLQDLNPFMNSPQDTLEYEFQVILKNGENNLNLTFSPGATNDTKPIPSYGYVNGIEIESIPEGLYMNEANPNYVYVTDMKTGYVLDINSAAFETAYRLNVGGEKVDKSEDNPGGMKRTWEADEQYIVGEHGVKFQPTAGVAGYSVNYTEKTPPYVAPKIVYETLRMMGNNTAAVNMRRNLTWMFEVDPGFDNLVRLHMREMDPSVTGIGLREMCVYIGGYVAQEILDIWGETRGLGIPMYKDFVISMPGISNGSKVALSVALQPHYAQYMPRGTLRDHLNYRDAKETSKNEVLSWKQRLIICLGSARGLEYLHGGTKQLIIHRDVKSTNILLDDNWTAKVSDFGLSKVGPASDTGVGHVSTIVKGSFGYLDPEYYQRGQLTLKSDVYSFGVVLFEVLCARPAVELDLPKVRACYTKGILYTIVDPTLTGQITPECLSKFGEIAELCIRANRDERPSMRDVVWSLEFMLTLQQTAESTGDVSLMVDFTISSNATCGGENGASTISFGEYVCESRAVGVTPGPTVASNTAVTNSHMEVKSCSVFSEIFDLRAR